MTATAAGDARVLAPLGRRRVPVIGNERVGAYDVITLDDADGPQPQAGQFFMLAAVDGWGGAADERPFLPRAFSHYSAVDGRLTFVLEDVGPGTHRLGALAVGEQVWLLGPLGRGFVAPRDGRAPILVAGGVGIAPVAAQHAALGAQAPLLLGFRDQPHAQIAARLPGAQVATDDGSVGTQGFVTELLDQALAAAPQSEVYACGPPPMLEAVRALCERHGVPAQLALESGMACGFGACFGCVVATKAGYVRLCVDGPVLEAADLDAVVHV